MFENNDPEYKYTIRGTCFLCRYAGIDYAITAKHVVKDYSAEDAWIPFHPGARKAIPYNEQVITNALNAEDTDCADLAFFRLERSMYLDSQFAGQLPYLISDPRQIWQPTLKGHFILRGFPSNVNTVDYDEGVIGQRAFEVEADYIKPSPMDHCHNIQFRDTSMCSDLDGLSGTPVFWIGDTEPHDHLFAGLLLRAGSDQGHFVHATVILDILHKIMKL